MRNSYRTFIALNICPERKLLNLLTELRNAFSDEKMKWVESGNLHLTLRFLGETPSEQVKSIKEILSKTANHFRTFNIRLKGLGYFQNNGQPRVLFAGVTDVGPLRLLVSDIENSIAEIGVEKSELIFRPHLTLARIKIIKNKKRFYSLVEKYEGLEMQTINVNEIVYYQSILKPEGPVYISLQKACLKD